MGTVFDPDVFAENLRCKIIYYSCINPNTISDLNKAWGYSSPTYLYQKNSLEQLKDADLITVEKEKNKNLIQSNYSVLFGDENVERGRAYVNREILKEFLIHAKGFYPPRQHAGDEDDLLNIGRGNLEPELEQSLQRIEFDREEYEKLIQLWQNDVFKHAFLSLDIVSKLFADNKDALPNNPLDYLFRLTAGTVDAVGRVRDEKRAMELPLGLRYQAERVIVPTYRAINSSSFSDAEHAAFVTAMKDTYSLFRTKFRRDRFDYGFIQNFVDLTMQSESDKRFGSFLKKYRNDKNGLF